jgi:hypothetical protein
MVNISIASTKSETSLDDLRQNAGVTGDLEIVSEVRSTMVPATSLARELVGRGPGGLEELRVQEFPDDESAQDDDLHARLHAEFSAEFDRVQAELARTFGEPLRTGAEDDDLIPLNGVFRFALWEFGDMVLFVAAAHEDRDCPLLLMLGTTGGDCA